MFELLIITSLHNVTNTDWPKGGVTWLIQPLLLDS